MTSSGTLLTAWISYLFHPGDGKFQPDLSVLDRHFLVWVWRSAEDRPRLSPAWAATLQKAILIASDTHIVTGIAIMIAGFIQSHDLTVYHFHIVVFLAWQASSTHLTTLTILRKLLRGRHALLQWRLLAMFALFVMLFIAVVLTGSSAWRDYSLDYSPQFPLAIYLDSHVVCGWDPMYMKNWEPDNVLTLLILITGYTTRLSRLFAPTSKFFRKWCRSRPSRWLKSQYHKTERSRFAHVILYIYVYLRSLFDLVESLLSELIWLLLSLLWGTSRIFAWRQEAPFRTEEDTWGFGQLLPLFLLFLPIVSLQELYSSCVYP